MHYCFDSVGQKKTDSLTCSFGGGGTLQLHCHHLPSKTLSKSVRKGTTLKLSEHAASNIAAKRLKSVSQPTVSLHSPQR